MQKRRLPAKPSAIGITDKDLCKLTTELAKLGTKGGRALGKELGFKRDGQDLAGLVLGGLALWYSFKAGRALVQWQNAKVNSNYAHLRIRYV